MPDAHLFRVEIIEDEFLEIASFLTIGCTLEYYTVTRNKQLATKAEDFQLIAGQLYKLGADGILRRCVVRHER